MQQYVALQPVWHSQLSKQFEPGECLELEHLTADQIQSLTDSGVVKPVAESALESSAPSTPMETPAEPAVAAEPETPPSRARKRTNSKEGE